MQKKKILSPAGSTVSFAEEQKAFIKFYQKALEPSARHAQNKVIRLQRFNGSFFY